jgi:hypothetical protein
METLKLKFYRGSDAPEGMLLVETITHEIVLVRCRSETTGAVFFPVFGGTYYRETQVIGWTASLTFHLWENERKKPDEFSEYRGQANEVQGYRNRPPEGVPLLLKVEVPEHERIPLPLSGYYPPGRFASPGYVLLGFFDGSGYWPLFSPRGFEKVVCWRPFEVTPTYIE